MKHGRTVGAVIVALIALTTQSNTTWAQGVVRVKGTDDLPVNRWVLLDCDQSQGYDFSQLVYAPSRGEVLHWGSVWYHYRTRYAPRNDVRAFDAAKGDWVSDYPSAKKLPGIATIFGGTAGASYKGMCKMLPDGSSPEPSTIVHGVTYDSKRKRLVYTIHGLMAAYDPETRKWEDLKAKTVLYGKELDGPPPVYGIGTCYDPINDEILMFPQWKAHNTDRVGIDDRITGHYGTFIYSFKTNTWTRPREALGSPERREQRSTVLALLGRLSKLLDQAWLIRKRPAAGTQDDVAKGLNELAAEMKKAKLPDAAAALLAQAAEATAGAAKRAAAGDLLDAVHVGSDALHEIDDVLSGPLAIEPPARTNCAMVYDPKHKVIVLHGGMDAVCRTDLDPIRNLRPHGRNDTWVYDCVKRQWRALNCPHRPPVSNISNLVYDPASGKVLRVDLGAIWALDMDKDTWSKVCDSHVGGGYVPDGWFTVALDAKDKLLLLVRQVLVRGKNEQHFEQQTWAMRLDVSAMTAQPAPVYKPEPPRKYITIPPDDPKVVAGLKALPADNKWHGAAANRYPVVRTYSMVDIDQERGWLLYGGGGHATYQINNTDIYVVGAGKWVTQMGEHNDLVPPVHWRGQALGMVTGGRPATHYNGGSGADGRLIDRAPHGGLGRGGHDVIFLDIDRGGLWREIPVKKITFTGGLKTKPKGSIWMMPSPDGTIRSIGGSVPRPRDTRAYMGIYDVYDNTFKVIGMGKDAPAGESNESMPVCYIPDRDAIFYLSSFRKPGGRNRDDRVPGTWLYDCKTNTWKNLHPKHQPQVPAVACEYVTSSKCVYVCASRYNGSQWVYSFEKSDWARLTPKDIKGAPYAQIRYVQKYDVLVACGQSTGGATKVMRIDPAKADWK